MPDEIQTHDKAKAAARVNQASVARLAPKVFSTKMCSTCPTKSCPRSPSIYPLPRSGTRTAEGHRKGGMRHWLLRSRLRCAQPHPPPSPTHRRTAS